jgi:FKBP-type peptidyl-prolyl cis-trans isomerase
MARRRDRAFAWFFAIIFIISSSALTIAIIVQAASSKDDTSKSQEAKVDNTTKLQGTQLANFQAPMTIPELKTEDVITGNGKEVKAGDTVTVDYTGAVASTGTIFQSSKDTGQPATFGLSQVIAGWSQGIPGMKVGGTRRLYIPANLAYGANPPSGSGIPANADLVFDVTLQKIGQ